MALVVLSDQAIASTVIFGVERCVRTDPRTNLVHDCTPVTEKFLNLNFDAAPTSAQLLTQHEKKRMFHHEEWLGEKEITIGAWKPDPLNPRTVINVSLMEKGKGQVDYNEVSFFEDKKDNYISLSLRSNTQGEYYRIKIKQKE